MSRTAEPPRADPARHDEAVAAGALAAERTAAVLAAGRGFAAGRKAHPER